MGIDALTDRLKSGPAVTSVTATIPTPVTPEALPALSCTSVTSVTAQNRMAEVCDTSDNLTADQLAAIKTMQCDTAERHAGRVPAGDTAWMLCNSCGPVWIHTAVAAVLSVVDGWPRALGCPWCFVRKAGGVVPRATLISPSGDV